MITTDRTPAVFPDDPHLGDGSRLFPSAVGRVVLVFLCMALLTVATPLEASAEVSVETFGEVEGPTSVAGYRGAGLEVVVRRGAHWGLGTFMEVPEAGDEAWFRYMIVLDEWSPSQSGKLPGFASLRSTSARGCIRASRTRPGWSARMMYRPVGASGAPATSSRIGYYVYHLDQPDDCGEIMEWADAGVLAPGRWYCVEGYLGLNRPGSSDGRLRGWVDGVEAFDRSGLRFRETSDVGIDDLWMNVFSGGKPPSPERLGLRLDEVAVSTGGRVGCPDAFDDDESDVNEASLNRLADMDAFPVCAPFRACPGEAMSRGDFAALLAAAADLPGGEDAFSDDESHPHEASIDALAAAGLTSGCSTGEFCPDDPISRGAAAGMIVGAFGLPAVEGERFRDVADTSLGTAVTALVAAGVARGCGPGLFCPDDPLTRSQAAAMVAAAVSQSRVPAGVYGRIARPSIAEVLERQQPARRTPI